MDHKTETGSGDTSEHMYPTRYIQLRNKPTTKQQYKIWHCIDQVRNPDNLYTVHKEHITHICRNKSGCFAFASTPSSL